MEELRKTYAAGEIIFREGEYAPYMYALAEGTVDIYVNYGKHSQQKLSRLNASEKATFGEMGIVDAMPRSITAVAVDEVAVNIITRESFGEYFRSEPEVVMNIMRNVSRRIREQTEDYIDACRAVAEAMESETDSMEKSRFKKIAGKFIDHYRRSAEAMAEENKQYNRYFLEGDKEDFYSMM